jgi:hypothetical protein
MDTNDGVPEEEANNDDVFPGELPSDLLAFHTSPLTAHRAPHRSTRMSRAARCVTGDHIIKYDNHYKIVRAQ